MSSATPPVDSGTGGRRFGALDGVRGVFMMAFMLFHFGAVGFAGAWTAVNQFFILSAYLIASLLLAESARHGSIDALAFYRRRARRLLPALFLVLVAVGAYGLVTFSAEEKRALGGDIFASLGFVVNWRLIGRSDDYFGDFEAPSPLRHLWTLAVEEQFYLLVPVLLGLLFAMASRRTIAVLMIVVAVALAWLTSSLGVGTPSQDARVYYGTDTRGQILALGVALAVIAPLGTPTHPRLAGRRLEVVGWVGLAISLANVVLVAPMAPFMFERGGMLLLGLAAVAVTYACARPEQPSVARVLAAPPLVWLGRRSYSLYLWHWPVTVVLHRELPMLPTAVHLVVALAITIGLSHLTFRYLEEPVMRGGLRALWPGRSTRRLVVAAAIVTVLWPASSLARTSMPEVAAGQGVPAPNEPVPEGVLSVGVHGDSVARGLAEQLPSDLAGEVTSTSLAIDGCHLTSWTLEIPALGAAVNSEECHRLKSELADRTRAASASAFAIFAGQMLALPHVDPDGTTRWWPDEGYVDEIRASLDDVVEKARAGGARTVVLATLPCRRMSGGALAPGVAPPELISYVEEHPEEIALFEDPVALNSWLVRWAEEAGVLVFDLYEELGCADGHSESVEGVQVFKDLLHLSTEGAALVWNRLLPQLRAAAGTQ